MGMIDLTDAGRSPLEEGIIAAALVCIARWGVGKTTVDDIAREAGCSRATLYRAFPGGKDVILAATARREMVRALEALDEACRAADDLDELLTCALWSGVTQIRNHAALQYLLAHEPGVVLPWLSFDAIDPLLETVTGFLAPLARRFVEPAAAAELAESVCRLVIAYAFEDALGSPVAVIDRASAGHVVSTFLVPGVTVGEPALAGAGAMAPSHTRHISNQVQAV